MVITFIVIIVRYIYVIFNNNVIGVYWIFNVKTFSTHIIFMKTGYIF